jgi:hypothetical protein
VLDNLLFWSLWVEELHVLERCEDGAAEGLLDESHGDLLLRSVTGFEQDLSAVFVVSNDTLHHTNSLWEWAVVIVFRESILLEELILDNFSHLKSSLLIFTEGILTNQLDDFNKIVLFLEDVLHGDLESHEVWISLVVIFGQHSFVVGE